MAKGSAQGIGSTTVWMVIFAGLWLTATVFLVILYTGQEELRNEIERVQDDNQRLISGSERGGVTLFQNARKGGPTVVGLLEGARKQLAELASGEATDDVAAVRAKRDQLLRSIREDGIVPQPQRFQDISYQEAMTFLYSAYADEHTLHRNAAEQLAQLQTEVDRLAQATSQQKSDFDRRAQELSEQLVEVERDRSRYREQRDSEFTKAEQEFERRRQQTETDLKEARERATELEEHSRLLQQRVATLREQFGGLMIGPEERSTARRPDGRILTAIPGDEVVFIDLGRAARLTLGMRFAVYAADTGIPVDGRAKAQIEVLSMSEASAECKIVALHGPEPILQGDLVANPAYDSARAPTFVVVGQFDLDHDNVMDSDGAAVVESMITAWGGSVSADLSALTDFVVAGGAPPRPRKGRDPSPEQLARYAAMQHSLDQYNEVLGTARALSIPVLTQEVFLNFLGYSGRVASR